jgi:S-adenosylmethionine-diacylgycerolhomoserine-N-methlytransferase
MRPLDTKDNLIRHYKKDASIYDFNRRFFLFGRSRLINQIGRTLNPSSILEIGCGTGVNLIKLSKLFPSSKITGVDVSPEMLNVARTKISQSANITLINDMFDQHTSLPTFDLILCSYTASTVPNLSLFLSAIATHLTEQGHFACVDFHSSRSGVFERWISHSIPIRINFPEELLVKFFAKRQLKVSHAYAGIWKYFHYIGQKR